MPSEKGLIGVRASGLLGIFDCARRWKAFNVDGMRMPTNGKAWLGTCVHAATAAYDKARMAGQDPAPGDFLGVIDDMMESPAECVEWDEGLTPEQATEIAKALYVMYCEKVAPQFEYVAVEMTCEPVPLPEMGIRLTGTVDRVYADGKGGFGIVDIKTGLTAVAADGTVKTAVHACQLGVYSLLAMCSMGRIAKGDGGQPPVLALPGKIIGLQAAKTPKGRRVGIGTVGSPASVVLDAPGRPGALSMAARIIKEGLWFANPRSGLCGPKYCPVYEECCGALAAA